MENAGSDEATFTDRDVVGGVTYVYRVKAINSDDVGPQSDAVTFEYGGNFLAELGDDSGPERPTGLDVWNVTGGIQLKWRVQRWTTGYQILRRHPGKCEAFQVHAENTGSTSAYWKDTDVEVETRYEYRVVLINRFGRGSQSTSIEVTRSEFKPWGTIYSIFPGYTFEGFINSSGTMAVGRLELDDDPDTVDYTWRGDVTRDSDGSDADSCEGDGLGEDREVTEVNSRTTMIDFTFGGAGCRVGDYTITYVVHDRNGNEERSGTMSHEVIGVTIDGRAQVGETLSADVSTIRDTDAFEGTTFTYQWYSYTSDGDSYTEIEGATSSTYTAVPGDLGKTIKVGAVFTDTLGQESGRESFATAAVVPVNSAATGTPTISGTAQVGQTLTASTSGISDTDGLTNVSYSYQWISNDGTTDSDIQEATSSTYTLVAADQGDTIKVRVSFTDDNGNDESLTSTATATVAVRPNNVATGAPTITGTAQVGETLTASTAGISDSDGLTHATYTYQWLADDTEISSATSSTYTLVATDEGKAIKVRVSFTDDRSNTETLTSVATSTVMAAASQSVGNRGEEEEEQQASPLTAAIHDAPDSHNGSAAFTFELRFSETPKDGFSYRTLRDHAFTVTGGEVVKASRLEPGKDVKWEINVLPSSNGDVTVSLPATTDCTAQGAICTWDERKLSAEVEVTVAGPGSQQSSQESSPATGTPTISGTAQVDETLTAGTAGIADADGLTSATFAYQWVAGESDISGATSSSYALTSSEQGKAIKVRVTFTDDAGHEESLTSGATAAVAARPNSPATGSPTITGTPQVGETLTASTSGIADADGLTTATFDYQWLSSRDTEITGATSATYTLLAADQGEAIKVRVSFTDDGSNAETLTSAATGAVAAQPNSPATGAPSTSGTAQVDETLTAGTAGIADADGLTSATFAYQWVAGESDISGATSSSYALTSSEQGKAIKVRLSFTDDAGNSEELTSAATASVAARPNSTATGEPTISGTVQVRETLTASTSGIADTDGLTNVSYSYQWIRNDGSSDTDIQDPAGSSYTLVDADEGKTIKVKVSFTDDAGHEETLTSAATALVEGAPEPLTVSLENNPASHNGTDEFTFQIRFSEQFGLSYKTLRDHAFTVDGGTVKKAQRQVKGSNIGWTITVEPDSNAAVRIVLPATTDCDVTGAICTEDGRKLSNSLDFTVVGPGE